MGKKKVVRRDGKFEGKEAGAKVGAEEQIAKRQTELKGTTASETKKEKKKRPVACIQRYTDREFRREFPAVFEALMEKAKAAGTAEIRILLQIGKFGDPKVAKRRGVKSLSEMLMDELKRRQDEREAAAENAKTEAQAESK
ncbi:MAG TPA: hypothetical protein VF018_07850 [Acidobacteriaceae bacterium]